MILQSLLTGFTRIIDVACKVFMWPGRIVILGIVLFVTASVIARYILHVSVGWAGELSSLMLVLVVFFALGEALREERHVRALFIFNRLPERMRPFVRLVSGILCLGATCIFLWQVILLESFFISTNDHSDILRLPLAPWGLVLCVGSALFALEWVSRVKAYAQQLRESTKGVSQNEAAKGRLSVTR